MPMAASYSKEIFNKKGKKVSRLRNSGSLMK
jgi:hypothetical protein